MKPHADPFVCPRWAGAWPGRTLGLWLALVIACSGRTDRGPSVGTEARPTPDRPAPAQPGTAADAGPAALPAPAPQHDASGAPDTGTGDDAATAPDADVPAARDAHDDRSAQPTDDAAASSPAPAPSGDLHLESTGFLKVGADLIFPKSASYPIDQSPPFSFAGVPAGAKSLAITFVDHSIGAVKWVVWDIPPRTPGLPANLSKTPHPAELPTSTQRGSLGRTGYSGPGVKGPPLHIYDFQLYALDVATLPGTAGADTVTIRAKLLAAHALAKSPLFTAKGQLGGVD